MGSESCQENFSLNEKQEPGLSEYPGIEEDAAHGSMGPAALLREFGGCASIQFPQQVHPAFLPGTRQPIGGHIDAVQQLVLRYGYPYASYVDCHAIFRFVRGRDARHVRQVALTDDIDPQWKQMLRECGIKPLYALSPQAKGKIERPSRWLQDHLIRTCLREDITSISEANRLLAKEVHDYHYRRVHSTTGEIPARRFQQALREQRSLFRPFTLPPPFQSAKDLFCFRVERTTTAYRRIALDTLPFSVRGVNPSQPVTLRIAPRDRHLAEVRFWHEQRLVDVQTVKRQDLKSVHFSFVRSSVLKNR
jgi:hypothetical protein